MNTPLPLRGEAIIHVERPVPRDIKVKVNFNSLARIEEKLGTSIIGMMSMIARSDIRFKHITVALHEIAIEAKEKLTYDQAGEIVYANGISKLAADVMVPLAKAVTSGSEEFEPKTGEAPGE